MKRLLILLLLGAAHSAFAAQPQHETLPLVVNDTRERGTTMAVLVSGDGGWAAIDKAIAQRLTEAKIPVVGLNALEYFWRPRTPEGAAADLEQIIRGYSQRWRSDRVLLVGYSRGADVLPFMINRLPADVRRRVAVVALLGVSSRVNFEFHVSDWLRDSAKGLAVAPELTKITVAKVLCFYGTEEDDSVCRSVAAANITAIPLRGDHHFNGDYDAPARRIIQELR